MKAIRRPSAHSLALLATAIAANSPETRPVLPAGRYTVRAIEATLLAMEGRVNQRTIAEKPGILSWIKSALEDIHTDDWLKGKSEQVIAASRGDREALELHAAGVITTTENFVRANSNWMPFFEEMTLGDDEYPMLNSDRPGMAITIDSIGQDGGNRTVQAQVEANLPTAIPMNMNSTGWIEYPLVDLYRGTIVKELALAQFDVARDRLSRTESLLASYLLVNGTNTRLTNAFTLTGDIAGRDYYADGRVNASNLPGGNLVTLAGNSTTSLFRKEVFDAIMEYCMAWGAGALSDGDMAPVEIVVASSHATAFYKQVGITSTTNSLVEQIFNGGFIVNYGPYKWAIVFDNTIDPNQGVAYVRTNKPVGNVYTKPTLSRTITDESANLVQANKGRVCETWADAYAMPKHWRKNTLGVRYKTPA